MLRLVLASTAASIGSGVAAGILLSFYSAKLVAHWIDVGANNPVALLSATMLLLVAGGIACVVPALRAVSIDPMDALRRQ